MAALAPDRRDVLCRQCRQRLPVWVEETAGPRSTYRRLFGYYRAFQLKDGVWELKERARRRLATGQRPRLRAPRSFNRDQGHSAPPTDQRGQDTEPHHIEGGWFQTPAVLRCPSCGAPNKLTAGALDLTVRRSG